jgi:putative FmdB family regulatory protein
MPIYAYRCADCGHTKDVLQKLSDPVLTTCPACGKDTFSKQLTAAGFQLKGSGWYVTDFRGGNNGAAKSTSSSESKPEPAKAESSASSSSDTGSAGGCGTACACH